MTQKENSIHSSELSIAHSYWHKVALSPTSFLLPNPSTYRTAFGKGVELLGGDNPLWKKIPPQIVDGKVTIAGVEFTQDQLSWIGQYYKSMNLNGKCMDERLNETDGDSGIHENCGAAAAIGTAIGMPGNEVEDVALMLTHGKGEKGKLLPDMENQHEALTVMVTLGSVPQSLKIDQYDDARKAHALPFHTFIDINAISAFASEHGIDRQEVFSALLNWNLKIALQLMSGNHNSYKEEVINNGYVVVVDSRGVDIGEYPDLMDVFNSFLLQQQATDKNGDVKNLKATRVEIR